MQICVYGASSNDIDPRYLEAGEALGLEMAKRGHGLVFGGGASGLMGAVARGMTRGDGSILGVAPSFFNVDGILYEHCTEFIYTETMRQRKSIMEERADAFAKWVAGQIPTGSNLRGSAAYRTHLAEVLCRRAVMELGGKK